MIKFNQYIKEMVESNKYNIGDKVICLIDIEDDGYYAPSEDKVCTITDIQTIKGKKYYMLEFEDDDFKYNFGVLEDEIKPYTKDERTNTNWVKDPKSRLWYNIKRGTWFNEVTGESGFLFGDEFKEQEDTDTDISNLKIEILRGKDILRPFNYYNEYDPREWDTSCANFNNEKYGLDHFGYLPKVEWYDFYIKNPDHCGIATIFEKDKMVGRAPLFEGINLYENSMIQKGEKYSYLNFSYTNKKRKYKKFLSDWAKNNNIYQIGHLKGVVFIEFDTEVAKHYPPVDQLTVNVKKHILASNTPTYGISGVNPRKYQTAYKLDITRPDMPMFGAWSSDSFL